MKDRMQPKSRKKMLYSWVAVIVISSGSFLYVLRLLSKPVSGEIKRVVVSEEEQKQDSAEMLESELFSLRYPKHYKLQSSHNISESGRSWIFIAPQALGLGQASKIAVSVSSLPSAGLEEDSSYKHAEAFPELYSISSAEYANGSVAILERQDPSFERTVLWPHQGLILTISLTAAEKTEKLIIEQDAILRSVVWHK